MRVIYSGPPEKALLAAIELAETYKCLTVTDLVDLLYPDKDVPPETFDVLSDAIHQKESP